MMSDLAEYTTTKAFWRCGVCKREFPQTLLLNRDTEPHVCAGVTVDGVAAIHQPTIMRYVERERVFPSFAAQQLLDNFERSDWGLLDLAVEREIARLKRDIRKRPGINSAMRGVTARLESMRRAFRHLRGAAPADTRNDDHDRPVGGRIAERWPDLLRGGGADDRQGP